MATQPTAQSGQEGQGSGVTAPDSAAALAPQEGLRRSASQAEPPAANAGFTPGPWRLETTRNEARSHGSYDYFWYEVFAPGRETAVAEVYELDADERDGLWDPESRANAHLIAVAPELLTALYQYRNDLRYPPAPDSVERRLAMIEALITKAGASS